MRSLPLSEFLIEPALANSNTVELRALPVGNERNQPMWQYETIHLGQQEEKLPFDPAKKEIGIERYDVMACREEMILPFCRQDLNRFLDREEEMIGVEW